MTLLYNALFAPVLMLLKRVAKGKVEKIKGLKKFIMLPCIYAAKDAYSFAEFVGEAGPRLHIFICHTYFSFTRRDRGTRLNCQRPSS